MMLQCEQFQIAEWVCRVYWTLKGYKYESLTKNEAFFETDIDFFVWMKDGRKTSVEVKGSNYSRSVFVELEVQNKYSGTKKKGWFYKCRAEWLFVVSLRDGFIYAFKMEDLREYLNHNAITIAEHDDRRQHTKGKVVYIDDMRAFGIPVKEINFDLFVP